MVDLVVEQQFCIANVLHGSNKQELNGRLTHTRISSPINSLVTSLIRSRVAPNLTFQIRPFGRISELKFGRIRIWLKLVFWSQNNTPVIKLMASTMLSAAIEAVHFSVGIISWPKIHIDYRGNSYRDIAIL